MPEGKIALRQLLCLLFAALLSPTVRVLPGRTAAAAGVKVYPLSPYFIGPVPPAYQGHVLLGYGSLSPAQIQQGVALLSQAWAPFTS